MLRNSARKLWRSVFRSSVGGFRNVDDAATNSCEIDVSGVQISRFEVQVHMAAVPKARPSCRQLENNVENARAEDIANNPDFRAGVQNWNAMQASEMMIGSHRIFFSAPGPQDYALPEF